MHAGRRLSLRVEDTLTAEMEIPLGGEFLLKKKRKKRHH
jgi:hypothetical protein